MSRTSSQLDTPAVVLDLADSCVRFVKRALRIELDYTPETLPILDHYLREAQGVEREEVLNLVAPAAGAYFGEVVRRQLGPSRWHWVSDDFGECRIEFDRCFLSFNPIGSALEAVLGAEVEGYGSHLALLPEDEGLVRSSLERTGDVREDDYYRLAVRFEVLEQVIALLVDKGDRKRRAVAPLRTRSVRSAARTKDLRRAALATTSPPYTCPCPYTKAAQARAHRRIGHGHAYVENGDRP